MDKVSIITVVYNDVKNIERTILSVVNQTYKNIEYIVIDGVSTDGTIDICNKYMNNISIFSSEKDTGIYNAMNKGIKKASGDWVFFLNSGDLFYDESVIESFMNIDNKGVDIFYGMNCTKDLKKLYHPKKITKLMFALERMICHQGIFARREVFENNYFDESYRLIADRKWLYKCYQSKYIIKPMNILVCIYDTNGVSSNKEKFDKESLRFIKELGIYYCMISRIKRGIKLIKCQK